jgi:hypothetical protein
MGLNQWMVMEALPPETEFLLRSTEIEMREAITKDPEKVLAFATAVIRQNTERGRRLGRGWTCNTGGRWRSRSGRRGGCGWCGRLRGFAYLLRSRSKDQDPLLYAVFAGVEATVFRQRVQG